jgi:hypothetical protein
MTWQSFEKKAGKIRKAVRSIAGNNNHANVLFEPVDYEIGLAQMFENLIKTSPHQLEREETPEGIWYRETGIDNFMK